MSESSGTVRMQRTSKGAMCFKDVNITGKDITLENQRSRDIDLGDYVLERKSGRNLEKVARYVFPKNTIVKPNKSIKVVSYNFEDESGPGDLITDRKIKIWGIGNGTCSLFEPGATEPKAFCDITYQ